MTADAAAIAAITIAANVAVGIAADKAIKQIQRDERENNKPQKIKSGEL